jgi:hypothetical protein
MEIEEVDKAIIQVSWLKFQKYEFKEYSKFHLFLFDLRNTDKVAEKLLEFFLHLNITNLKSRNLVERKTLQVIVWRMADRIDFFP